MYAQHPYITYIDVKKIIYKFFLYNSLAIIHELISLSNPYSLYSFLIWDI